MFERMNRAIELHGIHPPIDRHRFAFEDLAQAIKNFPNGKHFGKVVCAF